MAKGAALSFLQTILVGIETVTTDFRTGKHKLYRKR